MPDQAGISKIVGQFTGVMPTTTAFLGGAGGFSGAEIWRISTPAGDLCLRRWPSEHPTRQQLAWIHQVLQHVARRGFHKLPVPRLSRQGSTVVVDHDRLWELTDWLPGQADFHSAPSNRKLEAALQALAEFHLRADTFASSLGRPPGIEQRRQQMDRLKHGDAVGIIEAARQATTWPELHDRALRLREIFDRSNSRLQQHLAWASEQHVALQPCIRDIWHDHVLFEGEAVSGLIDFGAMRLDHVAADIARLLGSLVGDDLPLRRIGLTAYQNIRPLNDVELALIDCYDRSGLLLAGMNWLEWIAVERREFSDRDRVLSRLDAILRRLES